jgi:hypothetical protein
MRQPWRFLAYVLLTVIGLGVKLLPDLGSWPGRSPGGWLLLGGLVLAIAAVLFGLDRLAYWLSPRRGRFGRRREPDFSQDLFLP